ncbi:MAG: ABC transporter ATP-binding protein [Verrucomicrobiota bacterium]
MNPTTTNPILEAAQLSVGYRHKGNSRIVLGGLDLRLSPGKFICLLGPNGTGKSTLLRTLSGLQAPLSGQLKLGNQTLDQIPPRDRAKQLSIVFTDSIPIGRMTSKDYVALGRHPFSGRFGGLDQNDVSKIDQALEAVGAMSLAHRQIAELSDGERQKVTIARALAQESRLMLLDEPTAYLDLPRRVECMQLLRDLCHQQSIGMLLSSHDLDLALRFADELWILTPDGKLAQGYPEALALNGTLKRSFANENLDWDDEQGSFRTHKTPCQFITLEGSGPERLWTQRALQRLGYGMTEDPRQSRFQISITHGANEPSWTLAQPSGTHTFSSLEALISQLVQSP